MKKKKEKKNKVEMNSQMILQFNLFVLSMSIRIKLSTQIIFLPRTKLKLFQSISVEFKIGHQTEDIS